MSEETRDMKKGHEPSRDDQEIGKGTSTLDYLLHRYEWLGELIGETSAVWKNQQAEIERLRAENAELKETHRLDGEALLKAEAGLALRDWYDQRERYVVDMESVAKDYPGSLLALHDWLKNNPKPRVES